MCELSTLRLSPFGVMVLKVLIHQFFPSFLRTVSSEKTGGTTPLTPSLQMDSTSEGNWQNQEGEMEKQKMGNDGNR